MKSLKLRVEALEEVVMPTLLDFFNELEAVDSEFYNALKEKLLKMLNSPSQLEAADSSKAPRSSFLARTMPIIREQRDPKTALPLPQFRKRLIREFR